METCPNCMTYRPARSPRELRRRLARLGTFAIAFVFALVLLSLMFVGERWLLVDAPARGIELGAAVSAAHAAGLN